MRFLLLLVGAIIAIWSPPAAAQAGLAGQPLSSCVAPLRHGQTPVAMFAQPRMFDCTTRQTDFGPGNYWVMSAPLPDSTATRHVRVRVSSLWQEGLTLYVRYADGRIAAIPTTSATLSQHIQLGAIAEFRPAWRPVPIVQLLWRVDGSANLRGIVGGQRLADAGDSARANMTMAAIYAGFAGLAFALLIYNLSLWWALRHRFQLAYCAMLLALLGYAFSSSGVLAWVVPGIDNNDRLRVNYVTLGLAAAGAIAFARSFFEQRIFSRWLRRATAAAVALLASSGLLFAALSHIDMPLADRLASVIFLSGLIIVGPILWSAWARGSRYLWLFCVAWAAPILFAGARILAALNLFQAGFWLDNSTVLSLAFEALVSSLAIAYRVQMLSRERDDALAGELQARELADADPLTGLLNRRAFLTRAIGRADTQVLHLIDIDHFKAVNDTLGHDGGDEVLRVFARALRTAAPGSLVARLGGEEFAILADAADAIDCETLLDRLRAARMPFDLTVTSSVGTCSGPMLGESDWKTLYRNADHALFEAKTAGRDRARRAPTRAMAA
ncbi:MAG: diguanylate cyclase [Pseudomonadota bacterium]